jgi:hypothetical protein
MPQLADRGATPLLVLDPKLEAGVLALEGEARSAFVAALHECLDRLIAHETFARFSAYAKTPSARPVHDAPVAGTPLSVRLTRSGTIRIDVVGIGGRVSGDEIHLAERLPVSLEQGAVGRRLADVVDVSHGLLDPERVVVGVSRRFTTRTAFDLSPIAKATPTYRQLVGIPSKRFDHLRVIARFPQGTRPATDG